MSAQVPTRAQAPAGAGTTLARSLHGAALLAAGTGVVMEVVVAFVDGPGAAGTMSERLVRLFSYFTILSNVAVAVTSALLVRDPRRDGRVFRVARLDALLCITVTGVVFAAVLRGVGDLTPAGEVSNVLLHYASPLLAVVAWLVAGPRPRVDAVTVWWSLAGPVAWLLYTFARGAATDWYPYPFLDVTVHGYVTAVANALLVAVLFLGLAALVRLVDGRLRPTPARLEVAP